MHLQKKISPSDFYHQFFALGGLHPRHAPGYFCVNRTTFMRWMSGQTRIPSTAHRCAQLDLDGSLPLAAGKQWDRWRFIDGLLVSPENQSFKMGEIRCIPWNYTLIAALKLDIRNGQRREAELINRLINTRQALKSA